MRCSKNASFIAVMFEQRIAAHLGKENLRPNAVRSRASAALQLDVSGFDALGAKPKLQGRPEGGIGGGHLGKRVHREAGRPPRCKCCITSHANPA